ncbi:Actin-related protein 2-A [Caligus rogercresseyi]|uniref:Actin-related protein 2-A n=1 Tax=Caligus rogercresseyi TaxID=217165 RepID=A0A7T8JUH8_CALRO|nr:Actin-related protein 2-A [Caligus rogercresseyi]
MVEVMFEEYGFNGLFVAIQAILTLYSQDYSLGYAFNHTTADFETVRMLKEKFCYIGYDIAKEEKLARETTFL